MKQLPFKNISYIDDILPELIWIGLINDRVGHIQGSRIIERLFAAVNELTTNEQRSNYALISSFTKLSDIQKKELVNTLKKEHLLDFLRDTLAPLTLLYDNCPLSFLGPPEKIYTEGGLIEIIKRCVKTTGDRYNTPAVVLYGAMFLARLVTESNTIAPEVNLPDLNAVINSPGSEEAERAAGFLRARGLAEFGILRPSNSWAKHFWNKNFEISACEFDSYEYQCKR